MERQLFAPAAQFGVTRGGELLQFDHKIMAPGDNRRAVLHQLFIPEGELRIDGGFSDYTAPAHPAVAFALRPRPGGFEVELAIPAAQLGNIPMQANRVIGLNLGLIDDDTGGEADGWLGWSGTTWRRADLCGDLLLLPPAPETNRRYLPLILRR